MMRHLYIFMVIVGMLVTAVFSGCAGDDKADQAISKPDEVVIAFYYPWYGNPSTDGQYRHWNHQILDPNSEQQAYPGGDNIGANFYPEAGCYSSNDNSRTEIQMEQLQQAGVDMICVSWWGQGSFEDKAVPALMDAATRYGIKVGFHIEPFENRSATSTAEAIKYIIDRYGQKKAFYRDKRYGHRPIFFIYDSYHINAADWSSILDPNGSGTIRGTKYDAILLALWVQPHEEEFILGSHFDGFYTYFASEGFTYGSSMSNWPRLARWANDNDKIFVPCVGPGYLDTRIRPWNTANSRSRDQGAYYDRMFSAAIQVSPSYIGLTSFNEWHEGTQIESAVPKSTGEYDYEDYTPLPPDYYLTRTSYWVDNYSRYMNGDSAACADVVSHYDFNLDVSTVNHAARNKHVTLVESYATKYDAGGDLGLVDGTRGTTNHRDGRWQGFEQVDFRAIVDLEAILPISEISVGFLQDIDAWIFLPKLVEIAISSDGEDYQIVAEIESSEPLDRSDVFISDFWHEMEETETRYIRVSAKNIGVCPEWHPGAGGKTWLFVDEIVVREQNQSELP